VRRVIALMAAVLLVLTIAGPVAADPIPKAWFPHLYVTTCYDNPPTQVPTQNAHGVVGWANPWEPGDTPWLLMAYTFVDAHDAPLFDVPLEAVGLDKNGKLIGPCDITWGDPDGIHISDAWFLRR
jgi:hypothetical protein